MTEPLISVVLPTHNRGGLVGRAIESVIAQTVEDWELVVVDDGSTDNTRQVVEKYVERVGDRIVYVGQEQAGAAAARNAGIDRSRGQFVAFLDSDDEFVGDKLYHQLGMFEDHEELGLVFCDMSVEDVDGVLHKSRFEYDCPLIYEIPAEQVGSSRYICGEDFVDYLVRGYLIPTITGVVRRDVLGDEVRFVVGQSYSEEWLFFLEVARRTRCGYVMEPLAVQHCQLGSVSQSSVSHNLQQQYRALQWIREQFPDVSDAAKRVICTQMVECCRQQGFDAYKVGRFGEACRHFVDAFGHKPSSSDALHAVQSFLRKLGARGKSKEVVESGSDSCR